MTHILYLWGEGDSGCTENEKEDAIFHKILLIQKQGLDEMAVM
jgi:hypothetical protein